MNVMLKDKAIKWLEDKAYPYSKNDAEALYARDILQIIRELKEHNKTLNDVIYDIQQNLYDLDIDALDIEEIIMNIPRGDE